MQLSDVLPSWVFMFIGLLRFYNFFLYITGTGAGECIYTVFRKKVVHLILMITSANAD